MTIIRKASVIAVPLLLLSIPAVASAAGLVKCGLGKADECGLSDFILLINDVITYAITLSLVIAGVMIMVAGFKMVTAAGDPGKIKDARGTITQVLVGLFVLLAAFLIIKFLLQLVDPTFKAPALR
jgi:hypothetical protein